jgi:Ca2+-binding RTX toxin-like protein
MEILLTSEASPERVQELIRALSYKNVATGTAVTGLRSMLVILEDAGGSTTSATVNVNVVNQGETIPPRVVLTGSDQVSGADTSLLSPFADIRIRDADSDVTVTIQFAAEKGRLVLPPGNFGTYDPAAGTYTVTGDPFDITDYIRTIQFDPRDRRAPVGTVETTQFTISVTDDGIRSDSKTVAVHAAIANRAPSKPDLSGSHIVKEMTADGTVVGIVSGGDPNQGDIVKYSLVGAEDAPFQLATQGSITQIFITNGIRLDYEQRKDYTFTLRATDARGLSNDTVVSIRVDDVSPENTAGASTNDVIEGGAGKDTLGGGLGDDKIFGGLGNDRLTGNAGKDIFVFNTKTNKKTNVDTIKDFVVKDDSIWLDNAVFTKAGKGSEEKPGKLSKTMFWTGKAAHDSSDRIIYDKASGALYYDQDGTGRAAQVKIATLKKGLSLTEKDFFVI